MSMSVGLRINAAAVSVAVAAATGLATGPVQHVAAPSTVVREIRLAAMVPPGGLITSFLHNQTVYCSLICPLLAQTVTTAVHTTLQAPEVFFTALPADGLLKAIGAAAASVTGPTDTAMEKAIAVDAAIPAQRALNAFEVGVVGLLNVIPAVAGGPTAILTALQQARQDTFDALNAPFVPNPTPTVKPHGLLQVAVVQTINVVAAVIFPAFNDVLAGVFQVPNAAAQTLAATGNPIKALAAGATKAVQVAIAAVTVVAKAIATAIDNIGAAAHATASAQAAPSAPKSPSVPKSAAAQAAPPTTVSTTTSTTVSTTTATKTGTKLVTKTVKRVTTPNLSQSVGQGQPSLATATQGAAVAKTIHRNVRGSHDGVPSRPALRATR